MTLISRLFLTGVVLACLTSCGKEKKTNDIIAPKPVKEKSNTVQKIGDYDQTFDADWLGSSYKIELQRIADPSLPLTDDGTGNKYYDNKISVRILRKDGSEFFSRVFTKSNFASCVDESYLKKNALLGIVYDKVEGDNVIFAASIGSPDKLSDDYVPLILKISRTGNVSISKDNVSDVSGDDTQTEGSVDTSDEDGV